MKNVVELLLLIALSSWCRVIEGAELSNAEAEGLYQRWHEALSANPYLTEPMFFKTEGAPQDLATVVSEIMSNKIAMAYFLCEKMARTQYPDTRISSANRLYRDVWLLHEVAGIDLLRADDRLAGSFARFAEEWRQGLYKDPSAKVSQLCKERLANENSENISPQNLVAIRRYGIFGLPELIRQVIVNNSKHAFAAYLIITGQTDKYSEYIRRSNHEFEAKEDKLKNIGARIKQMKAVGNGEADVMKKISAALAE